MKEYRTNTEEETILIAEQFASTLMPGDIVLLDGDLGAGKTVFAKGIIKKLSNGKLTANSPTFVIVNAYDTVPKVFHFDLYRIEDTSELDAIGAEEYFYSDAISLVEWPNRVEGYFPSTAIKVYIRKIDDNTRSIVIER